MSSTPLKTGADAVRKLERRAADARMRAAVTRWEYRQRHHAKGTWYRLRRALVDASKAYVISERDATELIAEGYRPEAAGLELQPAKVLLFVPHERVSRIPGARQVPLHLNVEFLSARWVALVGFEPDG